MAIVNITSYTGRLYHFDDVLQKFVMNPNSDAGLLALTGWDSTELSVSELSAEHNGTTIFIGRDDYSGDPQKFPVMVLGAGGVITNATQVKVRVDRDPTITQLLTTLSKEDMTDNLDGTHYIDVSYDVDKGYVYEQLAKTERWYFPSAGPFDTTYPQSISFTDADTGRSKTENYTITYVETAAVPKPWETTSTFAFAFDDATAPLPDYIDATRTYTATPTIGPDYPGTLVTKGNKITVQEHMNILNDTPGSTTTWTGKHLCYPYSNQKCAGRTSYVINGSGGNGFFNLQGDWSFEYDVVRTGPQSAAEYTDISGVNTYQHLLQVTDAPNQLVNASILSLYHYEFGYDADNAEPNVVINGTYCTLPVSTSEIIRNYKVFVKYHYNSGLDQGEVDIWYWHKYKNTFTTATQTIIASPPARTATQDITVNGGNFAGGFEQASHKGLGGLVYYDNVLIDPVNDEWMHSNCYYFKSTLNLGDSWTKTHNLDLNTQGYTNRILQNMHDNSIGRYKAFFARYAPDYHYTCPPGTLVPAWVSDYGHIPASGDNDDIIAMLDDRLIPNKVMLSYTGINHALIFYTAKTGNPAWGSVQWSAPVYYCLEHITALEARGIPWLTWDSCPSDTVLDTAPAPQEDLIGRHEDPSYSWYDLVSATKTINTYDVSNDPANNGRILPAYALGDGAHINETGYQALGDYIYTNHPEILP